MKDPETGKRVSKLNPEHHWITQNVLELRIIDEDLWAKVKERQASLNKPGIPFWSKQQPKNMFSGLSKCGECGGGYSLIPQTHMGCSSARNKGICDNRMGIPRKIGS